MPARPQTTGRYDDLSLTVTWWTESQMFRGENSERLQWWFNVCAFIRVVDDDRDEGR
jgi:hypothetical protein